MLSSKSPRSHRPAQGKLQGDAALQQLAAQLNHGGLGVKGPPLRLQHSGVGDQPAPIAVRGDLQGRLRIALRLLKGGVALLQGLQAAELVLHFRESGEHRLQIALLQLHHPLPRLRLQRLQTAPLEERLRQAGRRRPSQLAAIEQVGELRLRIPGRTGQVEAGKAALVRHGQGGVRRQQLKPSRLQIRPPAEQFRGQPGRNRSIQHRQHLAQGQAPVWILRQQQLQISRGLISDLHLVGDVGPLQIHRGLRQIDVQRIAQAAAVAALDHVQRLVQVLQPLPKQRQ